MSSQQGEMQKLILKDSRSVENLFCEEGIVHQPGRFELLQQQDCSEFPIDL